MLPLIIFAMALIVRMRLRDAFLVGLRLGVGFAGVFIVFDFFVAQISPAVEAISHVRGLDFPVLDVGWPPLAAITWSSLIGPLSIPFVILLNVIMVSLRWTRTVFIDLWNVWQFALMGALVQAASGSLWLGMGPPSWRRRSPSRPPTSPRGTSSGRWGSGASRSRRCP